MSRRDETPEAKEKRQVAEIEAAMGLKITTVLGQGAFGKVYKGLMGDGKVCV